MKQDVCNDHTTFLESYPHEFQNHVVTQACTEFYLLFSFYLTFFFNTKGRTGSPASQEGLWCQE